MIENSFRHDGIGSVYVDLISVLLQEERRVCFELSVVVVSPKWDQVLL